jgi:hypothetical protein
LSVFVRSQVDDHHLKAIPDRRFNGRRTGRHCICAIAREPLARFGVEETMGFDHPFAAVSKRFIVNGWLGTHNCTEG